MGEQMTCSLSSAMLQSLHLGGQDEPECRAEQADRASEGMARRPLKPLPSSYHANSASLSTHPARAASPKLSRSGTDSEEDASSARDEGEGECVPEWESKTTAPTSPAPSSPSSDTIPNSFQALSKAMSGPPVETHGEKRVFRFAKDQSRDPSAGRTPSPAAVSQKALRMLLPYWPRQEASQEVALLNASGEVGASILSEMEEQARAFAQERSLARSPPHSFSSLAKSFHQSSRHDGEAARSADEDDELVEFHSAVSPPTNHKKRKSSRSALEDPHYFGGSGVPDVTPSSGHTASAIYDDSDEANYAAEVEAAEGGDKHDDGVERPDVSSASFRASRLVDELYPASASQGDECDHDWPTHGRRCGHHQHTSPWAHRQRGLLRSRVRLRLSIRRAQSEFWSDVALLEAEQQEEERKAAAEAASARAVAAEAEKKRRERSSKAEKRVQALKGGKSSGGGGAGKKLTLADLRARTAAASQGDHMDGLSTAKPMPIPEERPPGPSVAQSVFQRDKSTSRSAIVSSSAATPDKSLSTLEAPSGPFLFRCDSSTTCELKAARLKLQAVLSKPFDDIVEELDLPSITQEARASWSRGLTDRQCMIIKAKAPMVWPDEDQPRAKFAAGTVSSAILRKMGQEVRERDKAKDFVFASWDTLSTLKARDGKDKSVASQQHSTQGPDPWAMTGSEPEGKRVISKVKAVTPNIAATQSPQPRNARRGSLSNCSQTTSTQPCDVTSPSSLSELPLLLHHQSALPSTVQSPSPSTPPQPPKTSPKMSRRKKANMNNIHHQLNSARWTTSNPAPAASTNQGGTYTDSYHEGNSSLSRPITASALFPDEYICLFCEYALFYGTRPLLLKACRHRMNTVKRKTQAEDKKKKREGKIAGTAPSNSGTGGHHHDHTCTECGCDISHQVSGSSGTGVASHPTPAHLTPSQEGTPGPSAPDASVQPATVPTSTSGEGTFRAVATS